MALNVEADPPPGQTAGHPSMAAGLEPEPVQLLELERDRRPAPDRVRVGEDLQHLLGRCVCRYASRVGHDATVSPWTCRVVGLNGDLSDAARTILSRPGSSS